MTILIIHNKYQFKGGEDYVVEAESELLKSEGHIVFLLIASNNFIRDIFFERNKFYKELQNIISDNSIDVAHIHNVYQIIGNDVYSILSKNNIPIVQTLHNFRFLCPAGILMDNSHQICEKCSKGNFKSCFTKKCYQSSYIKSFVMKELIKKGRNEVLKNVNIFIVLNEFCKNKYVESGFNSKNMRIKPNFLFYKPIKQNEKKEEYALYLGRIAPEKGVDYLIEAFETIDFPLKIAGTGDLGLVNKLKEKARKNKNIQFLDFVKDEAKQNLIQNASFLIIPSIWYETFGLVGLEAYALSVPILASNIGGLSSIVKNGETGYLFEPNNIESLKNAALKIIKNKSYIEMGEKAYQYFCENYTEKQNYTQLIANYNKAIESKKNNLND